MKIKKIINKIIDSVHYNSVNFSNYLKKKGVEIGEGTHFFSPKTTYIDPQYAIL